MSVLLQTMKLRSTQFINSTVMHTLLLSRDGFFRGRGLLLIQGILIQRLKFRKRLLVELLILIFHATNLTPTSRLHG